MAKRTKPTKATTKAQQPDAAEPADATDTAPGMHEQISALLDMAAPDDAPPAKPGRKPARVDKESRLQQIAELMASGLSQSEIARAMHIHKSQVSRYVADLKQRWRDEYALNTADVLFDELADLRELERVLRREFFAERRRAHADQRHPNLETVPHMLRIKERIHRMIGLDDTRAAREAAAAAEVARNMLNGMQSRLDTMTPKELESAYSQLTMMAVESTDTRRAPLLDIGSADVADDDDDLLAHYRQP